MVKRNQTYKCNVCGNIVSILHAGGGELVCCGESMELLDAKQEDEGLEKHVPVIEKSDNGILVKVGENPHPMEGKHYIEWIEVHTNDDQVYRAFLEPDQKPEALFPINPDHVKKAQEYCNVHGLWKS